MLVRLITEFTYENEISHKDSNFTLPYIIVSYDRI